MSVNFTGYFLEEGGLTYAVASDGRFVTHGVTREEAFEYMKDTLTAHMAVCLEYKLDPHKRFVEQKVPQWQFQPEPSPA